MKLARNSKKPWMIKKFLTEIGIKNNLYKQFLKNSKKPLMTKKCLTEIRIKNILYKQFLNKTEHTIK